MSCNRAVHSRVILMALCFKFCQLVVYVTNIHKPNDVYIMFVINNTLLDFHLIIEQNSMLLLPREIIKSNFLHQFSLNILLKSRSCLHIVRVILQSLL